MLNAYTVINLSVKSKCLMFKVDINVGLKCFVHMLIDPALSECTSVRRHSSLRLRLEIEIKIKI